MNLDLILGTDQTSPLLWTPKKKEEVHAIIGAMLKQGTGDRAAVHVSLESTSDTIRPPNAILRNRFYLLPNR